MEVEREVAVDGGVEEVDDVVADVVVEDGL